MVVIVIHIRKMSNFKSLNFKTFFFQKTPFYIFSESYGGKMTAGFSAVLYDVGGLFLKISVKENSF